MKETISIVLEDIILYNNNRFLIFLFFLALVFVWYIEKDRRIKTGLVYLSIALLLVFVCPLYAWIGMKVDQEIYYRVFWFLPVGLLFCYGAVRAVMLVRRKASKVLVGLLLIMVIMVNGRLVYTNTLHFPATNAYHIPQVVMDVADALRMEKYKPIAVLPAELLPFIRQYTGEIFTPYGRNILEPQWNFSNALYDAMEAEIYVAEEIAQRAREEHCAYVVLSSTKEQRGSLEDYDFFLKDYVSGYFIYMDYYSYEVFRDQNLLDEEDILEDDK